MNGQYKPSPPVVHPDIDWLAGCAFWGLWDRTKLSPWWDRVKDHMPERGNPAPCACGAPVWTECPTITACVEALFG